MFSTHIGTIRHLKCPKCKKRSWTKKVMAKELKSSIQSVFHNFATIEELNKAVYEKIYNTYKVKISLILWQVVTLIICLLY